jgi:hypothetical protein
VLRIAAKFMLGALLKALFGQFQKRHSRKFARMGVLEVGTEAIFFCPNGHAVEATIAHLP